MEESRFPELFAPCGFPRGLSQLVLVYCYGDEVGKDLWKRYTASEPIAQIRQLVLLAAKSLSWWGAAVHHQQKYLAAALKELFAASLQSVFGFDKRQIPAWELSFMHDQASLAIEPLWKVLYLWLEIAALHQHAQNMFNMLLESQPLDMDLPRLQPRSHGKHQFLRPIAPDEKHTFPADEMHGTVFCLARYVARAGWLDYGTMQQDLLEMILKTHVKPEFFNPLLREIKGEFVYLPSLRQTCTGCKHYNNQRFLYATTQHPCNKTYGTGLQWLNNGVPKCMQCSWHIESGVPTHQELICSLSATIGNVGPRSRRSRNRRKKALRALGLAPQTPDSANALS